MMTFKREQRQEHREILFAYIMDCLYEEKYFNKFSLIWIYFWNYFKSSIKKWRIILSYLIKICRDLFRINTSSRLTNILFLLLLFSVFFTALFYVHFSARHHHSAFSFLLFMENHRSLLFSLRFFFFCCSTPSHFLFFFVL